MGVPYLLTWLKHRHSKCFRDPSSSSRYHFPQLAGSESTPPGGVDNLYVDFNSLVHLAIGVLGSPSSSSSDEPHNRDAGLFEDALLHKLVQMLDWIVFEEVRPNALVYIAVDGVSPFGKLQQQRQRRSREKRHRPGGIPESFDSNCVTPGTPFMHRVSCVLQWYCVARTAQPRASTSAKTAPSGDNSSDGSFLHDDGACAPSIVLSDGSVPGEGETKIFVFIAKLRQHPDYGTKGPISHCIVSNDTDAVLCSLVAGEKFVNILRLEQPRFPRFNNNNNNNNYTSFPVKGQPPQQHQQQRSLGGGATSPVPEKGVSSFGAQLAASVFSVYDFRVELDALQDHNADAEHFEATLHDLVFVLLLFGNDFLPNLTMLSIADGQLDSLLEILINEFWSRGKSIIDPRTRLMRADSADYLLHTLQGRIIYHNNDDSSKAEQQTGTAASAGGTQKRPRTSGGSFDIHMPSDSDGTYNPFDEPVELTEHQQARCRDYWFGIQWSMLYSCGELERLELDWTYPYKGAPNLVELQEGLKTMQLSAFEAAPATAAVAADVYSDDDDDEATTTDEERKNKAQRDDAHSSLSNESIFVRLLCLLPVERSAHLLPKCYAAALRSPDHPIARKLKATDASFTPEDIAQLKAFEVSMRGRLLPEEKDRQGKSKLFCAVRVPAYRQRQLEQQQQQQQQQQRQTEAGTAAVGAEGSKASKAKEETPAPADNDAGTIKFCAAGTFATAAASADSVKLPGIDDDNDDDDNDDHWANSTAAHTDIKQQQEKGREDDLVPPSKQRKAGGEKGANVASDRCSFFGSVRNVQFSPFLTSNTQVRCRDDKIRSLVASDVQLRGTDVAVGDWTFRELRNRAEEI